MSEMKFTEANTQEFFDYLKQQTEYNFIQKPQVMLVEEQNEIKAMLNLWDSNGYNYSLEEINLLLDMLNKAKQTILELTSKKEIENANQQSERTATENSPKFSSDV